MKIRLSTGGKIRLSTRRLSYSNRGGARVKAGRVSAGSGGVRASHRGLSTGNGGTRVALVGGAGPMYFGINGSGVYAGARISTALTASGQRRAIASGMVVPNYALVPELRSETTQQPSNPTPGPAPKRGWWFSKVYG